MVTAPMKNFIVYIFDLSINSSKILPCKNGRIFNVEEWANFGLKSGPVFW